MIACITIIWSFSSRHMRKYFYNSFLGVHHLFLVLIIMMFYHPLSNIIKYQSNLHEYHPICERLENATTTIQTKNLTKVLCKGQPTFTSGANIVRNLVFREYFRVPRKHQILALMSKLWRVNGTFFETSSLWRDILK